MFHNCLVHGSELSNVYYYCLELSLLINFLSMCVCPVSSSPSPLPSTYHYPLSTPVDCTRVISTLRSGKRTHPSIYIYISFFSDAVPLLVCMSYSQIYSDSSRTSSVVYVLVCVNESKLLCSQDAVLYKSWLNFFLALPCSAHTHTHTKQTHTYTFKLTHTRTHSDIVYPHMHIPVATNT